MAEFVTALGEFAFLRQALFAGLMASLAAGVVGSFVVTRRITAIAGSMAHTVLGGMGAAYYLSATRGWTWLHPLHGAVVTAILAALLLALVRMRSSEREDTVISALWAVGMATGVLFLFHTPGYKADLMSYLFGNVLLTDAGTLRLLLVLDLVILTVVALFYHPLQAISFDEDFARTRGVSVPFFYTLLLLLTALTVVTLIYVVGVVMVIALLSLPVAAAGRFVHRLWQLMIAAAVLSALLTTGGLALSYSSDLPTGATTVLLAGVVYLAVHLVGSRRRRPAASTAAGGPGGGRVL
ncbi:MAG: metal ABC transporter permease [Candidatus Krumholzibacteriia bacterium]